MRDSNINKDIQTIKIEQVKIKNIITEIKKNTLKRSNIRLEEAEDQISSFENNFAENTQSEQ